VRAGILHAGDDSFLDDVTLQLRHGGDDGKHGPTHGGGRVQRLLVRNEIDAQRPEFVQCQDQLLHTTGKAVKAPDQNHVKGSWRRGQTFGADRFEAEIADLRPGARRSRAQQRLFLFLDGLCSKALVEAYLREIANSDRALSRQLTELLELIRKYGPESVAHAIEKASAAGEFGADYIANILRQQQCPRRPQPPLVLRDPMLNELATDPLSLLEYDAFILNPGKESHDSPPTEAESNESVHHEPPTRDDSD
jgi:hypothetical protein